MSISHKYLRKIQELHNWKSQAAPIEAIAILKINSETSTRQSSADLNKSNDLPLVTGSLIRCLSCIKNNT